MQLAYDSSGDLFVANSLGNDLLKFTAGRKVFSLYYNLSSPGGLTIDNAGNLFEADSGSGTINQLPHVRGGSFASGLTFPGGLAFDSAGNLFVTSGASGTGVSIIEITPAGVQSTFASGFSSAVGLAFDGAGNLFVANQSANNIVEIAPDGTQSIFASDLNHP